MPKTFDPSLTQQSLIEPDPDPDQFGFEARNVSIERRKKALAEAMRRQAQSQNPTMPDGQMVGGQYVRPHFL